MSTQRIKPGKASLIGGIAVAFAALVLWTAIAHDLAADSVPVLIAGVLVALGVGVWIRVADL
ncbi:MAG TPA: hypothetical protein VFN42_08900 [Acetobacteraceae bacterium]|nr:hypothetical protein [Acetobacteraceae bacterium]